VHERAGCPGERDLQAFARGELDTQAAAAVRTHVDDCVGCQRTLAEIRRSLGLEEPITQDVEQIAQTSDQAT
jgi:anti-sigma factor RsiW